MSPLAGTTPKSAEELLATYESQGLAQAVVRSREYIDVL